MGTWGTGAFDNDMAADWAGDLQDAAPVDRPRLLRAALQAAVDNHHYLEHDEACAAIAAAAIVAALVPDGPPVAASYTPNFFIEGGALELPDDTTELAVRALDRVFGEESEWHELWDEAGSLDEALLALAPIRAALSRKNEGTPPLR
ncbi:DUF4259 domain-containing protein [Nocardia sp. XZ_19_385]|uniref:DUF4259 domain-containing protein n=1 Tax=Nocardia sp. XZ_19_385 TaxID=2769488 RepID=UPI00188EC61E|nr:DUF4259 domain-containing protein [Nocardia sp. XZ_19_385]